MDSSLFPCDSTGFSRNWTTTPRPFSSWWCLAATTKPSSWHRPTIRWRSTPISSVSIQGPADTVGMLYCHTFGSLLTLPDHQYKARQADIVSKYSKLGWHCQGVYWARLALLASISSWIDIVSMYTEPDWPCWFVFRAISNSIDLLALLCILVRCSILTLLLCTQKTSNIVGVHSNQSHVGLWKDWKPLWRWFIMHSRSWQTSAFLYIFFFKQDVLSVYNIHVTC